MGPGVAAMTATEGLILLGLATWGLSDIVFGVVRAVNRRIEAQRHAKLRADWIALKEHRLGIPSLSHPMHYYRVLKEWGVNT